MADRAPSFGSQKMELWTDDDTTSTLVATIDAQTATAIVGSFQGMAQFSFTQTSHVAREALKSYYVKTNTAVTTLAYEDGMEADYYLGASRARALGKVLRFYWYGSEIVGTGKITEIFGKCYVSGDTGNLNTSTATAADSPIQVFPIQTIAAATFVDWDSDYTTTTTATLPAGTATVEQQGTIPT